MSLPFRLTMSATDPDEAHGWLSRAYMPYSLRLSGRRSDFRVSHRGTDFAGFSAGVLDHSITAELDTEPAKDFVLVLQLLEGRYSISSGRKEISVSPGECFVFDPDAAQRIWQQDVRLSAIRFDRAQLERVAGELVSGEDTHPLRFPLARPLSPEHARRWQSLVQYVANDLAGPASASPLVRSQSLRLATATLLETFPNNALPSEHGTEPQTDPRALQRAVDFIEESAAEDIDLTQIAAAARTSPRSLHLTFQARLHTTPLDFLRRVRLERAHNDLRTHTPDCGVTVTDIAHRWGFASPSRFVTDYRERYGCLPHQTLRV